MMFLLKIATQIEHFLKQPLKQDMIINMSEDLSKRGFQIGLKPFIWSRIRYPRAKARGYSLVINFAELITHPHPLLYA